MSIQQQMNDAFDERNFELVIELSLSTWDNPRDLAYAIYLRARALGLLGRIDEGKELLESHMHMEELAEQGDVWAALARFYREDKIDDKYMHAMTKACTLAPDANGLVLFGDALAERGDYAAAEAAFRRALELEPDHSEAMSNLASRAKAMDHHEQERLYREAIKLDSENLFAWEQLGILLGCFEPHEPETKKILEYVLEQAPYSIFARLVLAGILRQEDDMEGALAHFEHLMECTCSYVAMRVGEFFHECGYFKDAERVYVNSLAESEDHEILWYYGLLLRDMGQERRGDELIERAHQMAPDDVRIAEDRRREGESGSDHHE